MSSKSRYRPACAVVLGLALASCHRGPTRPDGPTTAPTPHAMTAPPQNADPASSLPASALAELRSADLVFVGEVIAVGPAPRFWSGRVPSFQDVEYRVLRTLKPKTPPTHERITIAHPIVKGGRIVRSDSPWLDEAVFHVGAQLIVSAMRASGPAGDRYEGQESDHAAVAASERTVRDAELAFSGQ
jgi:hypothetical protein